LNSRGPFLVWVFGYGTCQFCSTPLGWEGRMGRIFFVAVQKGSHISEFLEGLILVPSLFSQSDMLALAPVGNYQDCDF
jgi:hypothetical protein